MNHWLKINKLSLNIIKSKFMLVHMLQRKITLPKLYIDDILIGYVTLFLCFRHKHIKKNLKWDTHINSISWKIGWTVDILNKKNLLFV